jgi:hypothetical protein
LGDFKGSDFDGLFSARRIWSAWRLCLFVALIFFQRSPGPDKKYLDNQSKTRKMLKRGFVKTPSPFKWFFQTLSFFSSYRFSKRWLHTLIKEFT